MEKVDEVMESSHQDLIDELKRTDNAKAVHKKLQARQKIYCSGISASSSRDNISETPRRAAAMRMMMHIAIPVKNGNEAARTGAFGAPLENILKEIKPEATYSTTSAVGERGGYIILDMQDTSQMPAVAEPFFLAYNARVTFSPVMNSQDLAKAAPGIERAVKQYAKAAKA